MKKCAYTLTMKNDKGQTIFELRERKNKLVKAFLKKAITDKWVLKFELFEIIKNTFQFNNIWEFFEAQKKQGD